MNIHISQTVLWIGILIIFFLLLGYFMFKPNSKKSEGSISAKKSSRGGVESTEEILGKLSQLRIIGSDDQCERNRLLRLIEFLLITCFFLFLPFIITCSVLAALGFDSTVSRWIYEPVPAIATAVILSFSGGFYISLAPRRLFLWVPENQGFVTQDTWTSKMVSYGPGLHLSRITESRSNEGNHSLAVFSETISVIAPTESYDVTLPCVCMLRGVASELEKFHAVSGSTIVSAIEMEVRSFLLGYAEQKTGEEVVLSNRTLNTQLRQNFGYFDENGEYQSGTKTNLCLITFRRYGIVMVEIKMGEPQRPAEVAKAMAGKAEADQIEEIVARTFGVSVEELHTLRANGKINDEIYRDAHMRAMVITNNAEGVNLHSFGNGDLQKARDANMAKGGER